MHVVSNVLELFGRTPMVELSRELNPTDVRILMKVEMFNPGGSVKDRIGLAMVERAEREGKLEPGMTLVEPTSGNTGVGIAIAGRLKGYPLVVTIPDKMSQEKIDLLRAYGAEVVVCRTDVEPEDPESYYSVAERIAEERGGYVPNQYEHPANPQAHYETTGPEIWEQTNGELDAFVCGVGTGGTISGAGRYLKAQNENVQVVGVDPEGSMIYTAFYDQPHDVDSYAVEGIGEDLVPETLDMSVIDEMIRVADGESFRMTRRLVESEGLLIGGSCGAAVLGTLRYAEQLGSGTIATLLPDSGRNYIKRIYNDEWMRENGYLIDGS